MQRLPIWNKEQTIFNQAHEIDAWSQRRYFKCVNLHNLWIWNWEQVHSATSYKCKTFEFLPISVKEINPGIFVELLKLLALPTNEFQLKFAILQTWRPMPTFVMKSHFIKWPSLAILKSLRKQNSELRSYSTIHW